MTSDVEAKLRSAKETKVEYNGKDGMDPEEESEDTFIFDLDGERYYIDNTIKDDMLIIHLHYGSTKSYRVWCRNRTRQRAEVLTKTFQKFKGVCGVVEDEIGLQVSFSRIQDAVKCFRGMFNHELFPSYNLTNRLTDVEKRQLFALIKKKNLILEPQTITDKRNKKMFEYLVDLESTIKFGSGKPIRESSASSADIVDEDEIPKLVHIGKLYNEWIRAKGSTEQPTETGAKNRREKDVKDRIKNDGSYPFQLSIYAREEGKPIRFIKPDRQWMTEKVLVEIVKTLQTNRDGLDLFLLDIEMNPIKEEIDQIPTLMHVTDLYLESIATKVTLQDVLICGFPAQSSQKAIRNLVNSAVPDQIERIECFDLFSQGVEIQFCIAYLRTSQAADKLIEYLDSQIILNKMVTAISLSVLELRCYSLQEQIPFRESPSKSGSSIEEMDPAPFRRTVYNEAAYILPNHLTDMERQCFFSSGNKD